MCVFVGTNGATSLGWKSFRATASGSCTWAGMTTLLPPGVRGALSVYNRTGVSQKIFISSNCTGSYRVIPNGWALEDLGVQNWSVGGYP